MPYSLIKHDQPIVAKTKGPLVFLGGRCKGRDWRLDFFHRFEQTDINFINPQRDQFVDPEFAPSEHVLQVSWERQALDEADICVFWLGEGLHNQAARVEIGYALATGKPVLLGAEEGFVGMEHLAGFSGMVLSKSIDGLMNRFASLITSYKAA